VDAYPHFVASLCWLLDLPGIMPSKRQRLDQVQGDWTAAEIFILFKPGVKYPAKITNDREAYDMLLSIWDRGLLALQEQFIVVFMNNCQQVVGWRVLNIGSMETCIVDIRLLVSLSLHCMASYVILAHNHPSGILEASLNDRLTTFKIKKALRLIDVQLFDHIIISVNGYLSMKVEGSINKS
jgi:DNA repair protein RadC